MPGACLPNPEVPKPLRQDRRLRKSRIFVNIAILVITIAVTIETLTLRSGFGNWLLWARSQPNHSQEHAEHSQRGGPPRPQATQAELWPGLAPVSRENLDLIPGKEVEAEQTIPFVSQNRRAFFVFSSVWPLQNTPTVT